MNNTHPLWKLNIIPPCHVNEPEQIFTSSHDDFAYCFTPYQRLWLYNGAPLVAFYDTLGIRRTYSRLKRLASSRGSSHDEHTDNHSEDDHETSQPNPDENVPKFIVLKPTYADQPLTKSSPFAIEKSILRRYGTVRQVKKLKDGRLLIEAAKNIQARLLLDTQTFLGIDVDADAHRSLNVCKGKRKRSDSVL